MPQDVGAKRPRGDGNDKPVAFSLEDLIMTLPSDVEVEKVTALSLGSRNIAALPPQLAFLKGVRKVDLSGNRLRDVAPLAKMTGVVQLNLANNLISSLEALRPLRKLTVLNVAGNRLANLAGIEVMPDLSALIVPDNQLTDISAVTELAALTTLVVSRNPLGASALSALREPVVKGLRKLSATQCGLQALPVLDCPMLTELRLSGNELVEFPEGSSFRSLKILEVASNKITSLASMRLFSVFVTQLSIHGNPLDDESCASVALRAVIARQFKSLKTLDSRPFVAPTKEELRASRAAASPGANSKDTAAPKPVVRAPVVVPLGEEADVVYEAEVPAQPEQKTYVRATRSHRREGPRPPVGHDAAKASVTSKPAATGAAALALLAETAAEAW